jgi:thioredoxin reductase (NADPH)
LYAGRAKYKTRVLEKAVSGGQVLLTESIENFPGVIQLEAVAWVEAQKKQLALCEGVHLEESVAVERVENQGHSFKIHALRLDSGKNEVIEARSVIIATGAHPKRLGIPQESALTGRGVSYCAVCDGPLFRNKEVVVVGGGDSALEEALYLAKLAKKVTLIHRRDGFRAAAVLQDRVRANNVITLALESVPEAIVGESRVEGIRIKSVRTSVESLISCQGVFIFIGFAAATGFLKGQQTMNDDGRIVTDERMATSLPGIFACGDCRARPLYQIVTACADGAIAAHAAGHYLERATT